LAEKPSAEKAAGGAAGKMPAPTMQFSAFVYVADEEEGVAKLDVLRLGDQSRDSQVKWITTDASGKASQIFEHAEGTLHFGPGDGAKQILVHLQRNDNWSSILDFGVMLKEDGLVNAQLGRYGSATRVKVVDKDAFPSNEFSDIAHFEEEPPFEAMTHHSLVRAVRDFCWLNFTSNEKVRWGTIKQILLDTYTNLFKLATLYLRVYFLDHILKTDVDESSLWLIHDRYESLYLYMAALIVPFGISHMLHYLKLGWGVPGTTTTWIQSALLRRYLNYSTASQNLTKPAQVTVALNQDAFMLAEDGYCNILALMEKLGNVAVMIFFQFTAPAVFGKPFRPMSIAVVMVLPLVLFLFLYFRSGAIRKALKEESKAQAESVNEVEHAVMNFRLISDYSKRSAVVEAFESNVVNFRGAARAVGQLLFNNQFFCKWLSQLLIVFWIGFGGMHVISGELSLGLFLCDIQIFQTMEEITEQVYTMIVKLETIEPALMRVVVLLNLPTDLHHRKNLQDRLRETTAYMRERVEKKRADDVRMDLLPITLQSLSLTCVAQSLRDGVARCDSTTHLFKGVLTIEQGTMVVLIGQTNGGKASRLRALGGAILPDNLESIFIPSHLRVLHIDSEPMFSRGSLFDNLTFGVKANDPDASEDRIFQICSMLEIPETVMELVRTKTRLDWGRVLSFSEKQKISLARAVIANPDVLIIHRPFIALDERSAANVGKVLKEFVSNRGVIQDEASFRQRRPRTCILSTMIPYNLEAADKIYRVTKYGADEVSAKEATETLKQAHVFNGHSFLA